MKAATAVEGADRFFARYRPDELSRLLERAGFTPGWLDREVASPDRTWLRLLARA